MTERLYYQDSHLREFDARVVSCEQKGKEYEVVLDRTVFYPEGGGQPGDRGILGSVEVRDTKEKDGEIVHLVTGALLVGETVHGAIDWQHRFDLMQQHSGEHIVSGILHRRTGCENVGFHLGEDVITIDFDREIPEGILWETEKEANEFVWADRLVEITHPDPETLQTIPYRSKKELTGDVRIVTYPGADICACCGTHVMRAGEIGLIKILSMRKLREGVRIEMICGERAFAYMAEVFAQNRKISNLLSAKSKETASAVERLMGETEALKYAAYEREARYIEKRAAEIQPGEKIVLLESDLSADGIRKLCDAVSAKGALAAVFCGSDEKGYQYAVIGKEDIREIIKTMNTALSGRGGGRDGFAQGSVQATRADIEKYFA